MPDPTEEPRYTLQEATRILAREECLDTGHDLDQTRLRSADGETRIVAVVCHRCGGVFTETDGPWVDQGGH